MSSRRRSVECYDCGRIISISLVAKAIWSFMDWTTNVLNFAPCRELQWRSVLIGSLHTMLSSRCAPGGLPLQRRGR